MPDDVACEILLKIKEYHELMNWFAENETALANALSTYYNGVDSKWDKAIIAIAAAEKYAVF